MSTPSLLKTGCCIAGGGPAGMMLGLLLARAGVDVVVLEKHRDFLRDFRGDTLHPSTLQVMHELGLLDGLLQLPHQKLPRISGEVGGEEAVVADFSHLPVRCPFIVLMPQWDFLDFLADNARTYPNFRLMMQSRASGLLSEEGKISGLVAETETGPLEVRADLVVAADGRDSTLRECSGLNVETLGAPIDVLWFRIGKQPNERSETAGRFDAGQILVRIDRGDYWQCGYVIAKGSADQLRSGSIEAFRERVAGIMPHRPDLSADLKDWNDVKLLTVAVDRMNTWWKPGFLAIGDAAHAMSPVGGIGINLAIQDAVAASNILAVSLRQRTLQPSDLEAVQRRRLSPTRLTQAGQVFIQNRVIASVLSSDKPFSMPLPLRLLRRFPLLRRIPARLIGMGLRPEHVETAQMPPAHQSA